MAKMRQQGPMCSPPVPGMCLSPAIQSDVEWPSELQTFILKASRSDAQLTCERVTSETDARRVLRYSKNRGRPVARGQVTETTSMTMNPLAESFPGCDTIPMTHDWWFQEYNGNTAAWDGRVLGLEQTDHVRPRGNYVFVSFTQAYCCKRHQSRRR